MRFPFKHLLLLSIIFCSCSKTDHRLLTDDFQKVITDFGKSHSTESNYGFFIAVTTVDTLFKDQRIFLLHDYSPRFELPDDLDNRYKINGYDVLLNLPEFESDISRIDSLRNLWSEKLGFRRDHPNEWIVLVGRDSYSVNRVLRETGYMPMDTLKVWYNL